MRRSDRFLFLLSLLLAASVPVWPAEGKEDKPKPAKLRVEGMGWLRDREVRIALERILGEERGSWLDANAVEDAAFLLISTLKEEGFQTPRVVIDVVWADGRKEKFPFDASLESTVPRNLKATEVRFLVERGQRSFIETVDFSGLTVLPADSASAFFRPEGTLFLTELARSYSPGKVNRAADNLRAELRHRGYMDAEVKAQTSPIKPPEGRMAVTVAVREGLRYEIGEVKVAEQGNASGLKPEFKHWTGRPWSPAARQDLTNEIRRLYFGHGFADVRVQLHPEEAEASGGTKRVTVVAQVTASGPVRIGTVRFEGNAHTRNVILRRRVQALDRRLLNPVEVEQTRYRLGRLGVFDSVDVRYDPSTGPVRDVVYVLKETGRFDTNLLFGYGSYEQLRGGVELRQRNLWGRAHQSRAETIVSMKSLRGEYSYTVPELFGESIDGTAKLFGLRREERAFLRQEYGANFTLKRPVRWLRAEGTGGLTFQSLRNAENTLATSEIDNKQTTVVSLEGTLSKERRDNPLRPRHGYRWFGQVEGASRRLGGQVDYQRLEFGGSYHTRFGSSRWVHLGLTHGVITDYGAKENMTVPVNKRFYPGGDRSIRGYQDGEAAPRGAEGKFIGAKSYLLFDVELEQALTKSWSVVLFSDSVGTAATLSDYPFDEILYTVGLGLRYHSLIGPIRLEYGRNMNPRPLDPGGTLHFSIGFPF